MADLAFFTVLGTIFIAELTDKDALLLLTLATKTNIWRVFAAGAIAFTASTALIVVFGAVLVGFIPIAWVKIAGGVIMLGYAFYQYRKGLQEDRNLEKRGVELARQPRGEVVAFLLVVLTLMGLDLAGDATELLIVVFVAQFRSALLVFAGSAIALVSASALEAGLGHRLGRLLSARKIRYFSIVVFLVIGSLIILSAATTG